MLDAEAALDLLLARPDVADPAAIFLFGRSLGGEHPAAVIAKEIIIIIIIII